jgi:putative ABC transport system substrate-binding protein
MSRDLSLWRVHLIALLAAAVACGPLAAEAQPRSTPVVGFLSNGSPEPFTHLLAAFRQGLSETGFVDVKNVTIEYRWAEGRNDRLPDLAAELVRRKVSVIAATGGSAPAVAAKAATTTIPIVFTGGSDPVKLGLVASLSRPGGNATGVINISSELGAKRLQLLRELVPAAGPLAVVFNPGNATAQAQIREIEEGARAIGQPIQVLRASNERDFDAVFASVAQNRARALLVTPDPVFMRGRARLVALAAKQAIPASYPFREMVLAGGLMSYGPNLPDLYRQAGVYVGRILKGAKPADLPVLQPSKFDLVINAKTARALGIEIPSKMLVLAEVIE